MHDEQQKPLQAAKPGNEEVKAPTLLPMLVWGLLLAVVGMLLLMQFV